MTVTCDRTGRELTTKYATTAFGPDRETVEEAFPGDVVGLVNATGLQLGDTLYAGTTPGDVPADPPLLPRGLRHRAAARHRPGQAVPARPRAARRGGRGAGAARRRPRRHAPILAAVGALQFEVFGYRLASEFDAPAEILGAGYQAIRRTDPASVPRLREIGGIRILNRSDGALVALFENRYRLARLEVDEPELTLEPLVAGAIPIA